MLLPGEILPSDPVGINHCTFLDVALLLNGKVLAPPAVLVLKKVGVWAKTVLTQTSHAEKSKVIFFICCFDKLFKPTLLYDFQQSRVEGGR